MVKSSTEFSLFLVGLLHFKYHYTSLKRKMFTRIKQDLIIGRDMPEMCYQNILITLSKTVVIFSIYLFLKNGLNINLF